MARSTQANIQNARRQPWVGGRVFRGFDTLGISSNANEAFLPSFGSTVGRVSHRAINGNVSVRTQTFMHSQRLQRAISGFDPDNNTNGLLIDPNFKQIMPFWCNVLNEEETKYQQAHYAVGGWNPLPTSAVDGDPLSEVVHTFTGQTGGRVLDFQNAWLFGEKLKVTLSASGLGFTGAATSTLEPTDVYTAPIGGNSRLVDAFLILDPNTDHYSASIPTLIYPITAGATILEANGPDVTITKEQLGEMPDAFRDVYATNLSTLYVLLVGMCTTETAQSDVSQLSVATTDVWSIVS